MNQESFEARILQLWMTTRVPFTRANLQFATGAPRKKMETWLRQLVIDGVLDADVDDAGEMIYTLRGADRPKSGPASPAELEKLSRLGAEARAAVGAASTALALRREVSGDGGSALARAMGGGPAEKSLVGSGLLSFFFGPLGWIYAGHWKEALPASGIYALAYLVLPKFLFLPVAGVLGPISAAIGVAYAWKYNRKGERQKILPEDPTKLLK